MLLGLQAPLPSAALGSVAPVAAVFPPPIASLSLPHRGADTTLCKAKGQVDLGTITSLEIVLSPHLTTACKFTKLWPSTFTSFC